MIGMGAIMKMIQDETGHAVGKDEEEPCSSS